MNYLSIYMTRVIQTLNNVKDLRGSTTQKSLIFQLAMLKIMLYVCKILCENFIQIGQ